MGICKKVFLVFGVAGFVLLCADEAYATFCSTESRVGNYINTISLVTISVVYIWSLFRFWKKKKTVWSFVLKLIAAMFLAIVIYFGFSLSVSRPISSYVESKKCVHPLEP